MAAIAMHPRSAAVQHKGAADYALVRELVGRLAAQERAGDRLGRPAKPPKARAAPTGSRGADAVMIARGALGNPWIFEELTGRRRGPPDRGEVIAELLWTMERAEEHLGPQRAARYAAEVLPVVPGTARHPGPGRRRLPAHREPRAGEVVARSGSGTHGAGRLSGPPGDARATWIDLENPSWDPCTPRYNRPPARLREPQGAPPIRAFVRQCKGHPFRRLQTRARYEHKWRVNH